MSNSANAKLLILRTRLAVFRRKIVPFRELYKTLHKNPVTLFGPIAFIRVARLLLFPCHRHAVNAQRG